MIKLLQYMYITFMNFYFKQLFNLNYQTGPNFPSKHALSCVVVLVYSVFAIRMRYFIEKSVFQWKSDVIKNLLVSF